MRSTVRVLWLLVVLLGAALPAHAGPFVVVNAATGDVLLADGETDPWFPASLTKLMTVYLALDAMRQGLITPGSPVVMSPAARAVTENGMHLAPGDVMMMDAALKLLIVKSANDVAVAVAEAVAGSQEAFVDLMNEAAQRLGMVGTSFRNPHGLYDPEHISTARDMAVLALALRAEFPEWLSLFSITAIDFGGQVFRTANSLLGRYPGADGMKSGFICQAGYNLVATATHGQTTVMAVLLGAVSDSERTADVARLLEAGFNRIAAGGAGSVPPAPTGPSPLAPVDMRNEACGASPSMRAGAPNIPGADVPAPLQMMQAAAPIPIALGAGVLPRPRPDMELPAIPLPIPSPLWASAELPPT